MNVIENIIYGSEVSALRLCVMSNSETDTAFVCVPHKKLWKAVLDRQVRPI